METLLNVDHQLFLLINHMPHTVLSDTVAMTISGAIATTVILWILLSVWLFVREEKRDHWFFLPVAVASTLSLLVTEVFLKNVFMRARPPLSLGAIQVIGQLHDFSFPSGHATFAWALAIVLSAKEPRATYFFYLLATLISLTRVYLGVHYPSDVVAGMAIGVFIGWSAIWVEQQVIFYRIRTRK